MADLPEHPNMPIKDPMPTTPTAAPTSTLMLIRHAETVWNADQRFQGHGDSPLTPKGRRDAESLGRRLAENDFERLISSDLGRARETAAIIAEHTGHVVETDRRLRERHYGVLEGLTVAQVCSEFPEAYARLTAGDPEYIVPGGESHRQHYDRNVACFKEFIASNAGATLALVVHGGVLDNLFRFVVGLPLEHPRCFLTANTSLSMIAHGYFFFSNRWVIQTWGDVAHLKKP
jgi:2,3-bisphosphoglycerate-dependent phosphoglycerate mutase